MTIRIEPVADSPLAAAALEALLQESYVGGGFTDADVAGRTLRAGAVRSRGAVLVALDQDGGIHGTAWRGRAPPDGRGSPSA